MICSNTTHLLCFSKTNIVTIRSYLLTRLNKTNCTLTSILESCEKSHVYIKLIMRPCHHSQTTLLKLEVT